MVGKIGENDASTSQVDQFAVVTTQLRLGATSRVEGMRHVCCVVSKGVRLQQKKVTVEFHTSVRVWLINYVQH